MKPEALDPGPTFIPHWSDDLYAHIDDVLDLIRQASREHPITSVALAKALDLYWEEVWAIVCHLQSIPVPVCNVGDGFWVAETLQAALDLPSAPGAGIPGG